MGFKHVNIDKSIPYPMVSRVQKYNALMDIQKVEMEIRDTVFKGTEEKKTDFTLSNNC